MTERNLTLSGILGVPEARTLERVIEAKGNSPKLLRIGNPEAALHFLRAGLCGSYVFATYVVPAYAAHVLLSTRFLGPPDDRVGPLMRRLMQAVEGELFNNNIFDRDGECHAHLWDAVEAFRAANGDAREFERFLEVQDTHGFEEAVGMCSLWGEGSRNYAHNVMNCTGDALTTFILFAANEAMTPGIYGAALRHLPPEERFNKQRRFFARHVAFDGDEHGPAALEWLELWLERNRGVTDASISAAVNRVLTVYTTPQLPELRP